MNHDVVDDARRCHHALPVEVQGTAAAATGPSVAHILDPDCPDRNTDLGGKIGDTTSEALLPFVGIELLECRPCRLSAALFNPFTTKTEAAILQLQWSILVWNQTQAIGFAEIQEGFAVDPLVRYWLYSSHNDFSDPESSKVKFFLLHKQ